MDLHFLSSQIEIKQIDDVQFHQYKLELKKVESRVNGWRW